MNLVRIDEISVNGLWSQSLNLRTEGIRGIEMQIFRWLDGGLLVTEVLNGYTQVGLSLTRVQNLGALGRLWRFPVHGDTLGFLAGTGTLKDLVIRSYDEPLEPSGIVQLDDRQVMGIAPAGSTGLIGTWQLTGFIKDAQVWVQTTQAGAGTIRLRHVDNWPQSANYFNTVANVPQLLFSDLRATYFSIEWTNGGAVAADFYCSILGRIG